MPNQQPLWTPRAQSAPTSTVGNLPCSSHPRSPVPADGPIGGTAQKVGGPLDKDGAIGQHFNADGAAGGKAQDMASDSRPAVFDKDGAVGKHFTASGAVGGTAQKVGGPFDKDGAVGKHFKEDGAIGGTVQEKLGGK